MILDTIENFGVRKIAPEENCPRLGLGFGLWLARRLGLGGNFPRTGVFKYQVFVIFK